MKTKLNITEIIFVAVLGFCASANAVQIQFDLTGGNTINITTTLTVDLLSSQPVTKPTTASGYFATNLNVAVDPATHQISADGIDFIPAQPGTISLTPMTFDLKGKFLGATVVSETITSSTLLATPLTPNPPTPLTASGNGFIFPVNTTNLIINNGTIEATGTTPYSVNCADTPIVTTMQTGNGTVTFSKTTDTLASVVYSVNLNVPISFNNLITSGAVSTILGNLNYKVEMSGTGTMNARSHTNYSQTFSAAYWDTSTAVGLQPGNGTWSSTSATWCNDPNAIVQNSLYAWTADAAAMDAYFNASGDSAITVSGNVAANSLNIAGSGYSFTSGAITIGNGGIVANQPATIGSSVILGAPQSWTANMLGTLTFGGNISAGSNYLTVKGAGVVSLGGANILNRLQIGDSTNPGNLRITAGTTALGNDLILDYGTVNLLGGTLTTGSITHDVGLVTPATFNFTGGTLKATASNTTFLEGLTHAYIKEAGAKIDSQTFDITIAQALEHGGIAATDGGLLKSGSGTLTLTGELTYTGSTIIGGGTLVIDNHKSTTLSTISGAGNLTIASSSTLIAASINVNTLSIGLITPPKSVPEPASLVMLAIAGILGSFSFFNSRR